MILVTGATGQLGGQICRRLRAARRPVRALVRTTSDPARVTALAALGVELRTGDLTVHDSLPSACDGVETIISAATGLLEPGDGIAAVDRDGQIALADAAQQAGVRHMLCISSSGTIDDEIPLIAAKRAVERHLQAGPLSYTTLRGGLFMDFWIGPASGFDLASGSVLVLGSGTRPSTWIAREDVAEFAVRCLDNPAADRATIELGGPQALSQLDVVRIAEDIGGRTITVNFLPSEELRRRHEQATTPLEKTVAGLMLHVAAGNTVDINPTLEQFPVTLTPVRDYIRRALNGSQ